MDYTPAVPLKSDEKHLVWGSVCFSRAPDSFETSEKDCCFFQTSFQFAECLEKGPTQY